MDIYGLTKNDIEEIRRIKSEFRGLRDTVRKLETLPFEQEEWQIAYGKIEDTIGARESDTVPSQGWFIPFTIKQDDKFDDGLDRAIIYNFYERKFEKDEEVWAGKVAGDWMIIEFSDTSTGLFKTPSTGIPAATHLFAPGKADCERLKFNKDTEIIESYQVVGGPLFEPVYNIAGEAIKASTVIQAAKISGAWFIDVEPCTVPSPP